MRLEQALSWGVKSVKAAGIKDAYIEILAFISHLLACSKSYIYSNLSNEFSSFPFEKFSSMVEQRLRHIPLAYITGQKEFMSLDFFVDKNVLIPRPETEILVEEILNLYPPAENQSRIGIDIGTGCGNIALSLAEYNHKFRIFAADISSQALKIARKNRKRMNSEKTVSFIRTDMWAHFKNEKWKNKIDFLVSNPPYVKSEQFKKLSADLYYEPQIALDGGKDGLHFYESLAEAGKFLLKKGGCLMVEIGEGQSESVKNIIENKKVFRDIFTKKDYSGIDRIIIARRK